MGAEAIVPGWPLGNRENLVIGNPGSHIALASLWTDRSQLARALNPDSYAVIGQQYSVDSSALLRNLAANPNIRHLVICGSQMEGVSGDALIALWKDGVDDQHRIRGIEMAKLEPEISREAIDGIRENVALHPYLIVDKSQTDQVPAALLRLPEFLSGLEVLPPWGEPQVFPKHKIELAQRRPSETGARVIRATNMGQAWLRILRELTAFGEVDGSFEGSQALGLTNIVTILDRPGGVQAEHEDYFPFTAEDAARYQEKTFLNPIKEPSVTYEYGERIFGYEDREQVLFEKYREYVQQIYGIDLPDWFEFVPELGYGKRIYTVGDPRTFDQYASMRDKLRKHKFDNASVAVLYDPVRDNRLHSDVAEKGFSMPCLTMMQASVRGGRLEMTNYFRSHDMYGAWPLNVYGLLAIHANLARDLEMPQGPFITVSSRTQIYSDKWRAVEEILKNYGRRANIGFEPDPRGDLIIRVDNTSGQITATHHAPAELGSQVLGEVSSDGKRVKGSQGLAYGLVEDGRISTLKHAVSMGRETVLAELAAKLGLPYEQDTDNVIKLLVEKSQRGENV